MSKCQAVCFLLSLSSTAAAWEQPKDKAEEVARGSVASAGSGCPRGAPGLGEMLVERLGWVPRAPCSLLLGSAPCSQARASLLQGSRCCCSVIP